MALNAYIDRLYRLQSWQSSLQLKTNLSDASADLVTPDEMVSFPFKLRQSNYGSYFYSENVESIDRIKDCFGVPRDFGLHVSNSGTAFVTTIGLLLLTLKIKNVVVVGTPYPTWLKIFNLLGINLIYSGNWRLDVQGAPHPCAFLVHSPKFGSSDPLDDGALAAVPAAMRHPHDVVIFDCILEPYFHRIIEMADCLPNSLYLFSPLKLIGLNSHKVTFLSCKGTISEPLFDTVFSMGESLNYSTQCAIQFLAGNRYQQLRDSSIATLASSAELVMSIAVQTNCATNAHAPYLFCKMTVPDIPMHPFLQLEHHFAIYKRTGVVFIPNGFYEWSEAGPMSFRVNLGKRKDILERALPALINDLRSFFAAEENRAAMVDGRKADLRTL